MLKKIGTNARHDIEKLLGSPIYLEIWVKVKKDWRDSDFCLKTSVMTANKSKIGIFYTEYYDFRREK